MNMNMKLEFGNLLFEIVKDKIFLRSFGKFKPLNDSNFLEIQIAGEDKPSHMGVKMANSSEGSRLLYKSHNQNENSLEITQESELVRTVTSFETYPSANTIRISTCVTNISDKDIFLEDVSTLVLYGISDKGTDNTDNLFFTRFIQSHHMECQPQKHPFSDYGFISSENQRDSQKRISFSNVGSWSTKEELPQGIIENTGLKQLLMFQIESCASWYYEISDKSNDIYLYLGGPNSSFGNWSKMLEPGKSYTTVSAAVSFGETLNDVIGEMTKYRRHIFKLSEPDKNLPAIFNEYMHLSWDSPTEENTKKYAPVAAKCGIEYYVIDCGWHNEEPGDRIYPYVGQWKESKSRFPHGIRKTTDFIRSLGMKAGLWIEPEIIGIKCSEMLEYYDDDCFLQRFGKKISANGRYFLDYRNPKVIKYMTETIRRMVEDYGADYIKFDYNQDSGIGTDLNSLTFGEGLELSLNAFFEWVNNMRKLFPDVIFEGCASGGMRMDYKTLSHFSLISTSDQTDYLKYPYIVGNILSAVIPEQAAVWSYPTGDCDNINNVSDDRIIMNMINSFSGRLHLASHLEWLSEKQLGIISEGVKLYKSLSEIKNTALPYFPSGFNKFGSDLVSAGLIDNNKIYLGVWNLSGENEKKITVHKKIKDVSLAFPLEANVDFEFKDNVLFANFMHSKTAAFFIITL